MADADIADRGNGVQDDGTKTTSDILSDLVSRAKALQVELERLQLHLKETRREGTVEIAHFRSTVQSEASSLERLSRKPESANTAHVARSSNLPFLEEVWIQAKRSRSLVALHKRIYYNSPVKSLCQGLHHVNLGSDQQNNSLKDRKAAVTVDTITDSGRTWTKVSLVTNTRLLFDLAKQGWQSEGSDDDDSGILPDDDNESDIPLLKNTRELHLAAQSYRVRTKRPQVQLILPRIQLGETDEVDEIIQKCTSVGVKVLCGEQPGAVPTLETALHAMVLDPMSEFSTTLNIDCTILLALVSEFSHSKVVKEPWFHKALQRQVEIEGNENLLPALLYPATVGHDLICTEEAAKRMQEIVSTIGTPSEKARTALLLDGRHESHTDPINEMRSLSAYEVPDNWRLPVRIVKEDQDEIRTELPQEALEISKSLSDINRSVFLYGWAKNITTITSNRTVTKQIENDLDKYDNLADSVFPSIWLCPTARSLVGKEKRGAPKQVREADVASA
ncbi:hypothetical protein DOTSEDRAFT_42157 [Dothistroma septosporum NZE10]|uniref:DUF1308 domain-containing protein n=1 Tax=Dothistroma septosporum (strain NZE10 / CBS 128990) TaxID=675120 RepID=N1Q026_DOTSN|nr:hypothetical protein DOTSEDRAFT_42157 [Dothistroma septosporum NZE10]